MELHFAFRQLVIYLLVAVAVTCTGPFVAWFHRPVPPTGPGPSTVEAPTHGQR